MSWRLVVDRHKLRHLSAAIAKLGTRSAGLDDGHADAKRRDLLGDRLHEAFDAPLGCVVQGGAWKGDLPTIGRNLDDAPSALSAEVWQCGADEMYRPDQIRCDDVLDLLVGKLFRSSKQTVACVADNH